MTTWERNLENVKRAQLRAKTQIASLEQQGLVVEKTLKDLAYRPLKQRYTTKQARDYINLLQKRRIESRARISFQMPPFMGAQNVSATGRYQEVIYARPQHIAEDLANSVYKALSYSLSKKTKGKSQAMASAIRRILRSELMLKSKEKYTGSKNIDKYFKGIKKDDFIKSFIKSYASDPQSLMSSIRTYYAFGLTSPSAKYERGRILTESAKQIFASNNSLSSEQAEALYDYFSRSAIWSKFRTRYLPSDDIAIEDNLQDMSNALISGLDTSMLDNLLMKHGDIGKAVDEYLTNLNSSN